MDDQTQRLRCAWTLLAVVLLACTVPGAVPSAAAQVAVEQEIEDAPVRYDDDLPSAEFHRERRQAVLDTLPGNAVAIFFSAPQRTRQNDVHFEYRQSSDLLYLTGTHEPGSVLVMAPEGITVDGERVTELLFVPPREPSEEVWTGRRFGADRAERELGVEKAVPYDRFEEILDPVLDDASRRVFHLPLPVGVEEGDPLESQLSFFRDRVRPTGSSNGTAPADSTLLRRHLNRLRTIKTEEEMRLLRRAIDITEEAHREVMRAIVPGMHEYEAEALIEYVFKRNGAEYPGFPSIVGSGENAVILHYQTNRRQMEADDVVVMDVGAEYHGYTADITRTVPVDGTFSEEQRRIYELVLQAQEAAIEATRAGNAFTAPHQAAGEVLAEGLAELGFISGPRDREGLRRFFMHGTSHYLGLDVHDVGTGGPLEPGTVITVEPGLYIAPDPDIEPRWWNIGVRIEDDVLVTGDGPVILSDGAPKEVAEVEALMGEEAP